MFSYTCEHISTHIVKTQTHTHTYIYINQYWVCLFGEILGRMKILRDKEISFGVWLEGGVEKNVVGPSAFFLGPPKYFFPKMGRKLGGEAH